MERLTKVNAHTVLVKTTASVKANNVVHGNFYTVIPQPNTNVVNVTRVSTMIEDSKDHMNDRFECFERIICNLQ